MGYDRIRADDASVTEPNIGQNDRAVADKAVVSDFHKGIFVQDPVPDFALQFFAKRMGNVDNCAIPGNGYIIAYQNFRMANNMYILFNIDPVPDMH